MQGHFLILVLNDYREQVQNKIPSCRGNLLRCFAREHELILIRTVLPLFFISIYVYDLSLIHLTICIITL
jgi:hypothetical protein